MTNDLTTPLGPRRAAGGEEMSAYRADIYAAIDAERTRQSAKWGGRHPWGKGDCSSTHVAPIVKAAVLAEECGEVARAVLDLHPNDNQLRTELIQVAAVAVAWLEAL